MLNSFNFRHRQIIVGIVWRLELWVFLLKIDPWVAVDGLSASIVEKEVHLMMVALRVGQDIVLLRSIVRGNRRI